MLNSDLDVLDIILKECDVMGAELDVDKLSDYLVPELTRWLLCRGLNVKGTKQKLIKR